MDPLLPSCLDEQYQRDLTAWIDRVRALPVSAEPPASRPMTGYFEYRCGDAVDAPARDASRGTYLCEQCFDAMTDRVLPASASPTGLPMAVCAVCRPEAW